jgi:hypothetical protein
MVGAAPAGFPIGAAWLRSATAGPDIPTPQHERDDRVARIELPPSETVPRRGGEGMVIVVPAFARREQPMVATPKIRAIQSTRWRCALPAHPSSRRIRIPANGPVAVGDESDRVHLAVATEELVERG